MVRRYTVIILLSVFTVLFVSENTYCQEIECEKNYPSDLEKYSISYYGGGNNIISPQLVFKADNNWEILLACIEGKTKDDLKEKGIEFCDSQLILLHAMRLLELRGSNLKTMLPILGSVKTHALRRQMRELAVKMDVELRAEIKILTQELRKIGRESNAFTILFSYALDDMPWDFFEEKDLVRPMEEKSREKPLWAGVYFACYPGRATRCGTNSETRHGLSFKVNWGGAGRKVMKYFNWLNLKMLLNDYAEDGRITFERLRKGLAETGIFDCEGKLTVPVIKENSADQMYVICCSIADKSARLFLENIDIERLMEEFDFYDKEKATVVTYHEWMWEYMDYLVEKGVVQRPFHFTHPEESSPKDIGALLFVVDRRAEK